MGEFLDLLDLNSHTTLTVDGQDGSSLTIGGGSGRYVIFYTSPDGDFQNFQSDTAPDSETVLLNIGGQEGDYRKDQLTDKAKALKVLEFYSKNGTPDLAYSWIE